MQYVSSTKNVTGRRAYAALSFLNFHMLSHIRDKQVWLVIYMLWLPSSFLAQIFWYFHPVFPGKKPSTFTFITLSSCSWKGRGKSEVLSWLFRLSPFLKMALEQFNQRLWYPWRRWLWRLELGVQICRSGLINYHGNRDVRLNEEWFLQYAHIHIQQLWCMIMA